MVLFHSQHVFFNLMGQHDVLQCDHFLVRNSSDTMCVLGKLLALDPVGLLRILLFIWVLRLGTLVRGHLGDDNEVLNGFIGWLYGWCSGCIGF